MDCWSYVVWEDGVGKSQNVVPQCANPVRHSSAPPFLRDRAVSAQLGS